MFIFSIIFCILETCNDKGYSHGDIQTIINIVLCLSMAHNILSFILCRTPLLVLVVVQILLEEILDQSMVSMHSNVLFLYVDVSSIEYSVVHTNCNDFFIMTLYNILFLLH